MGITAVAPESTRTKTITNAAARRRYSDLIVVNAVRALKVRYRGSILGIYWSLSSPLLMTAVYTTIFGTTFARYYGGSIVEYVLACFTGLAVLNYFSAGTSMALPTIVGNGGLLNKIALPPSVFPVSTIVANTFQLCVGVLPLVVLVTLVVSHNPLNAIALLVPFAGLVLLSLGFALAAASLFVYFRDLPYIYELIVFMLWITSPIFYPSAVVPQSVRPYLAANPIAMIVESVRQIALSGMRPSIRLMGAALLAGIVSFVLGLAIYRTVRRGFMDLI